MTTQEFSDAFDTLLNSYSNQAEFGDSHSANDIVLDEYEKSLFLTQAQEQIVVELYSGRSEKGTSFEKTEELRASLRSLIKTEVLKPSTNAEHKGVSEHSKFFDFPDDLLFITYEFATLADESAGCKDGSTIVVTPVTQDEYWRVSHNPFRQASKRKALRLDGDSDTAEIISQYDIKDYTIRYLRKPSPIILTDLEGLSINEESTITECELDSAMHMEILTRAVLLALASKGIQSRK